VTRRGGKSEEGKLFQRTETAVEVTMEDKRTMTKELAETGSQTFGTIARTDKKKAERRGV
jgi:hypothetical protein